MKYLIISVIAVLVILIFSLNHFVEVPQRENIKLDTDTRIYAGEGEVCKNAYIKLECESGLECKQYIGPDESAYDTFTCVKKKTQ